MGSEQFDDQEAHDLNNEAFWLSLSETFQMTLELLHEAAEEHGIDLDSLEMEEFPEREKFKDEMAKNHECCRAAKHYAEMVDDWFEAAEEMFPQREEEFNLEDGLDQPDDGGDAEEAGFIEALEVVRWYQYQIYVKLMRAVRGDLDEEPEILDEYPKDSDGSAKVALIGIERSIAAWGELRSHFPLQDDEVLEMLVHLEQLRRKVEKAFPDARAFIRPGFDKIDLNS